MRSPDPIDIHVGEQVRLGRLAHGLTQSDLGKAIGVTFQQVQKYEMGINRVSASRLCRIALEYGCEVGDFFPSGDDAAIAPPDRTTRLVAEATAKLPEQTRKLVLKFVRNLDSDDI